MFFIIATGFSRLGRPRAEKVCAARPDGGLDHVLPVRTRDRTLPGGTGAHGSVAAHARRLPERLAATARFPFSARSRAAGARSYRPAAAARVDALALPAGTAGGQHPAQGGGGARPVSIPSARGRGGHQCSPSAAAAQGSAETPGSDDRGTNEQLLDDVPPASWSGRTLRATAPCSKSSMAAACGSASWPG